MQCPVNLELLQRVKESVELATAIAQDRPHHAAPRQIAQRHTSTSLDVKKYTRAQEQGAGDVVATCARNFAACFSFTCTGYIVCVRAVKIN